MENLIIYAIAYLLGSIPFGLILAKQFAQINIQNQGSKSIGATNVLRVVKEKDPVLAKKLAIATIVLDFAKATIP
ncbi:TPA: glycerol-3-phosphate acyltransferase, partial [Campylobacter coli]|nr:glycerol-3-phosphate acyltransferase [Campylobacter coli]